MRIALVVLAVCALFPLAQAQELSSTEVLALVDRLEADPYHKNARDDMFRLFNWMDKTEEVVIFLADPRINKLLDRKRPYKRHLYMLMLGGMARYDLAHPDANLELPEVDIPAGYACMCTGYRNLLEKHAVRKDRYYKKVCRD